MNARQRLKAEAGGNISDSIEVDRAGAAGADPVSPAAPAHRFYGLERIKGAFAIPLDRIAPDPDQPRKEFDPEDIGLLAGSMKQLGQLMPARVRWDDGTGRWVIVAGERRFRAARVAGLPSLLCVESQKPLTPAEVVDEQLTENCVREDLKPIEQANAFRTLMGARGWTQRQLAAHLNISQAKVAQAVALLSLPGDVQAEVDAGAIPTGIAYELSRVGDGALRAQLALDAREGRIDRARLRELSGKRAGQPSPTPPPASYDVGAAVVTVRWKRGAGPLTAAQALARAAEQASAQDSGQAA